MAVKVVVNIVVNVGVVVDRHRIYMPRDERGRIDRICVPEYVLSKVQKSSVLTVNPGPQLFSTMT